MPVTLDNSRAERGSGAAKQTCLPFWWRLEGSPGAGAELGPLANDPIPLSSMRALLLSEMLLLSLLESSAAAESHDKIHFFFFEETT